MKLRTRRNSIRLRLTKGEITELMTHGQVKESITFGPRPTDVFTYVLLLSDAAVEPSAELAGAKIVVRLPRAAAASWASTEQVGIEASQLVASDGDVRGGTLPTLTILVEKDFACLKPRAGEDDADAFPNPLASSAEGAR